MLTKPRPKGLCVYILRSLRYGDKTYIGITRDVKKRLREHNSAKYGTTAKFKPWEVLTSTWFKSPKKAREFELFLKHGSGHAFAKKHFVP